MIPIGRLPRRAAAGLYLTLLLALATGAVAGEWIADGKMGCKVWNPRPAPGETIRWSGACKEGLAEGRGVLEWLKGGRTYERAEGEWRSGRQMAEGSQTWPGGQYNGQLADGMPHGQGVLIVGEARYEGAFLGGKPSGIGILRNASGVFDGQWRDGCFNDGKRRAAIGVPVFDCP